MRKKVNIKEIIPNTENPRSISKKKFNQLVKSIKDFPEMLEKRPLVVDENMVVLGGNMRLKALQKAGLKEVNVDIAEVIYSCTEEKGKNRGERLSEKFYSDLRENKVGVFVKLCDVLANVTEGKNTGSGMFKKYQKEYPKLKRNLYLKEYDKLFVELETLLEIDN